MNLMTLVSAYDQRPDGMVASLRHRGTTGESDEMPIWLPAVLYEGTVWPGRLPRLIWAAVLRRLVLGIMLFFQLLPISLLLVV